MRVAPAIRLDPPARRVPALAIEAARIEGHDVSNQLQIANRDCLKLVDHLRDFHIARQLDRNRDLDPTWPRLFVEETAKLYRTLERARAAVEPIRGQLIRALGGTPEIDSVRAESYHVMSIDLADKTLWFIATNHDFSGVAVRVEGERFDLSVESGRPFAAKLTRAVRAKPQSFLLLAKLPFATNRLDALQAELAREFILASAAQGAPNGGWSQVAPIDEFANVWGQKNRTMLNWFTRGDIVAERVGSMWRVAASELPAGISPVTLTKL